MVVPFEVIYLTGAPASGKSAVVEQLKRIIQPLEVFNYGQEMSKYLSERTNSQIHQHRLRESSARLITPEDVATLDSILLDKVRMLRKSTHILIETHAVTKEEYGFRVTPFSLQQFMALSPTRIVVLYTSSEVAISRIGNDPGGRPMVTPFESALHTTLQSSVALSYGTSIGLPVYYLDSDKPIAEIVDWFRRRVGGNG